MNFFRTYSHNFPIVEASLASKDKGLALRFFGIADKPDLCLYFSLVQDQPAYKAGIFEGEYQSSNDEAMIQIEGQLSFQDLSGEELGQNCYGK